MKKLLALLLALAMVMSLAACGGNAPAATTTATEGYGEPHGSCTNISYPKWGK